MNLGKNVVRSVFSVEMAVLVLHPKGELRGTKYRSSQAEGLFFPNVIDSSDSVIVTGFFSSTPPRREGTFKAQRFMP